MKTLRSTLALALAALLTITGPALATPPNSSISGKDSSGAAVTLGAVSDGTKKSPSHSVVDSTGAAVDPATSALQTSANTKLDTLHTDLGSISTSALQTSANTKLDTLHTDNGSLATSALQTSANTKLDTLHTDLGSIATSALQTSANTKLDTLHTDAGATTGSKAAGTAAASSELIGGVYNSSPPTLTNGQQVAAQFDAAGNHLVNCAVGCSGGFAGTAPLTVSRPADTNVYAINDTWADSTSAPTSGGFTFTAVCSASGKTSTLTTLVVTSTNDPATTLQGELWLFNTSVTAVNDNAAFALSDTDANKVVAKFSFALESTTAGSGTNAIYIATGLDTHVTCSGSANLRALVKVKNVYTPASAEALQFQLSFKGDN